MIMNVPAAGVWNSLSVPRDLQTSWCLAGLAPAEVQRLSRRTITSTRRISETPVGSSTLPTLRVDICRLNVECFRLVALAFKRAHVASATVLRVGTRHAALIGFQQMSQPILAATRVSGINGRTTREQRNSWRWPAVVR